MAALTHTTSGYYQGENLETLQKLILWELGQVIGTAVSFQRFPEWLIRNKLNARQNTFVFKSQCLKKVALLKCKADYRQYKCPVNCMDNGVIAAKYYLSSASYEKLEIVDLDFMNTKMDGYLVEESSDPEYAFMGDPYGNIPTLEVHPAPDADGTTYTASSDAGVVVGGGDVPEVSSNITGAATGGSTSTLQDSSVDFTTLGLVEGMAVVKTYGATNAVTAGSEPIGYIDVIATNTLTFTAVMTNSGQFDAGDSYNILAGEYGVLTAWDNDDVFIFSSEVGALASITVPAGNIRVDYVPYPLTFPETGNLGQYPEIPKLYHGALADGVVADFLGSFHEKSQEFKRADRYEAKFQAAAKEAANLKSSRPFQRKPSSIRPRKY